MEQEGNNATGVYMLSFVAKQGEYSNIEPCLYLCDSAEIAQHEAFKFASQKYPGHEIQVEKAKRVENRFIADAFGILFSSN